MTDSRLEYDATTAGYYDAMFDRAGLNRPDLQFYAGLARELGGPVLELGCGTGRVLVTIAASGLSCTGIDSSPEMLEVLRAKVQGAAIRIEQGLMQEFDLGGMRFKLVFSAFRAFQHLYSVHDQLSCIRRVWEHLEPGGVFAFDVFNPRGSKQLQLDVRERHSARFSHEGHEVILHESIKRDPTAQIMELHERYERIADGSVVSNESTVTKLRWFSCFELEHLLARGGFEDVSFYGDFDRSPVSWMKPELVVVARKP